MTFEEIRSIKKTEPRIVQIQETINSLLQIVDFEYDGHPVEINGFKLKDLVHWEIPDNYGAEALVAQLARKCDSDCRFCYHKGNPPDFPLGKSLDFVSEEEMETRLKYYKPELGSTLFLSNYEQKEVLYDPKTMKYLRKIRDKSDEPFIINTNGLGLTEGAVQELKALSPVIVVFSVNSVNQAKRDAIMNNTKENDSIQIMTLLSKYEVPFVASVAMWPTININDIEEAIRTTAQFSPYYIRLIMPGYTDYFAEPPKENMDEFVKHFHNCVVRILELRKSIDVPLVIYPEAYVISMQNLGSTAYLVGVVKHSPFYNVGIKSGDIIKKINGISIEMRSTASAILSLLKNANTQFTVEIRREDHILEFVIGSNNYQYPYTNNLANAPFGAMLSGGLNKSYVKQIDEIIDNNKAKNVLLMTSELMFPQAIDLFEKCNYPIENDQRKIRFCTPDSKYLGGNICIGDMFSAIDYIDVVNQELRLNRDIDLIIIPSSAFFGSNGWKRDISGVYYKHIEWKTGIQTELLNCQCFIF